MKVYKECCVNCLLSENSIVSPKRRKEILQDCFINQKHFICHKATIENKDVCCKKFYDTLGYKSQLIRIAQRLNMVEFINQPNKDILIPYRLK